MPQTCDTCKVSKTFKSFRQIPKAERTDGIWTKTCLACLQKEQSELLKQEINDRSFDKTDRRKVSTAARKLVRDQATNKRAKKKKRIAAKAAVTASEKELMNRALAKKRLVHFVKRFHTNYMAGWVHHDICRRLERFAKAIEAGESPRLMLFMPPRHGKSELASNYFPSWLLGHYPHFEVIAASYAVSLPIGFSRKIRTRLKDPSYKAIFPKTALDPMSTSSEAWLTSQGGGYVAAGVGGGITGKGAHCLIIDDPVKDAEEADSENQRDKVWDWYGSTAYTRLAPGGGVLIILCMTGDTPVLMADGTEQRLDKLSIGDEVATYDNGQLSTSVVRNHRSNGHDSVFRITTISGKMVRANERHPFLVLEDGELKWVRLKNLKLTQRIVTLKGNAVSGQAKHAQRKVVTNQLAAEGFAPRTTTKRSGPAGIAHRLATKILNRVLALSSNIGTALLSKTTNAFSKNRKISALFAKQLLRMQTTRRAGMTYSASITATRQTKSEGCSATDAIWSSERVQRLKTLEQLLDTSDFITDEILSIEPAGTAEVFDIQVDRTENFIANGLVSHNTRWHDDDLAGRCITQMRTMQAEGIPDEEIDNWEIIEYPAEATQDEYYNADRTITTSPKFTGAASRLLRKKGEALHPARFPIERLRVIKRTLQPRHWSALYQQNPVPDDGDYFTRDMFRTVVTPPPVHTLKVFLAGDLAIGEKQSNDWTVFVVGGLDYNDQLYILDVIRFKADTFKIVETLLDLVKKYDPFLVGLEKGQLELAIKPVLKKRMRERRISPTLAEGKKALVPISDKQIRARPLQGRMQQGMVYFDSSQPWYETVQAELMRFPNGLHDDIVDALAWLVRMVMRETPPRKPKHKRLKSWRSKLKVGSRAAKDPMGS